jgi:hypothetical protein
MKTTLIALAAALLSGCVDAESSIAISMVLFGQ